MTTINNSENLIEKVGGIERAREVVEGAPEGCDAYETDTHVFDLDDLRAAIADHDRIDTCTDIRNHISPNTKVIEHE